MLQKFDFQNSWNLNKKDKNLVNLDNRTTTKGLITAAKTSMSLNSFNNIHNRSTNHNFNNKFKNKILDLNNYANASLPLYVRKLE